MARGQEIRESMSADAEEKEIKLLRCSGAQESTGDFLLKTRCPHLALSQNQECLMRIEGCLAYGHHGMMNLWPPKM